MNALGWSGIHVYLHRDARATEQILIDVCAPILDMARDNGKITRWYFLRYWEGGPHLRLRVEGATQATARLLRDDVRRSIPSAGHQIALDADLYFAAFGAADSPRILQFDGSAALAGYQPETERYGGPDALPAAESFFVESSELARAVIGATIDSPDKRRAVAADLMLVFAHALGWHDVEAVTNLRRYFSSWDAVSEVAPVRPAVLVARARAALRRNPTHWGSRWRVTARESESPIDTVYSRWARMIGSYDSRLKELGLAAAARSRASWSQLHMFMNRIGIGAADERTLAWLVTAGMLSDYGPANGNGRDDLRYLLASASSAGQAPNATFVPLRAPFGSRIRFADLTSADGPPDDGPPHDGPLDTVRWSASCSFDEALDARRSRHSGYEPRLGLADLRMLVWSLGAADRRTYPSPGALLSTEYLVYCRNLPGVSAGTYIFVPGSDELVGTSALLDDADLEAISPYLSLSQPGATTDLRGAQLVVFLVSDVSQLVSKYGASALKLAWLETGHVSQTLLLAAAAHGMGSLVVAGFDDEALNASLQLDGVRRFVSEIIVVGGVADEV